MLNENIKRLRMANNLTQVQLAKDLGVSKQCISNWENDNIQPSIEMLIKLARYFKVTTDSLLDLKAESTLNISGLDEKEIAHIRLLIDDLVGLKH